MHKTSRVLVAVGLVAVCLSLFTGAAEAHVTVSAPTAVKGSFAKLIFRVPNERDTASTIGLRVQLPSDKNVFSSVSYKPKAGWKVELKKSPLPAPVDVEGKQVTEGVTEVAWTSDGAKIEPHQFDEFEISVGRLPKDASTMLFPSIQTYDNGEEVAWVETKKDGVAEAPKYPAPSLVLTDAAPAAGATVSAASTGGDGGTVVVAAAAADAKSSADTAKTVGTVGLILGVVALGLAGAAFVAKGKKTA